ncbi:hypothetical protein SCOR_02740 [Sulfidibacter corallicola]|uniref:Uncharacterized protein n=1 Tax=Sulfidibacter corallicola TaxID=2818388 RepID=A0A8A4TFZ2_SULCO|nr:hypothetical protein [Sulfidibacter corallicola]QTD48553.1 hypothetical protein J3U87_23480 [Sulfidibacter corallicola]
MDRIRGGNPVQHAQGGLQQHQPQINLHVPGAISQRFGLGDIQAETPRAFAEALRDALQGQNLPVFGDDTAPAPQSKENMDNAYMNPVDFLAGPEHDMAFVITTDQDENIAVHYLRQPNGAANAEIWNGEAFEAITTEQFDERFADYEYTIIAASQRSHLDLDAETHQAHGQDLEFYHYRAANDNSPDGTAPFHHERQQGAASGLCGLHALNAFVGKNQFSAENVGERLKGIIAEDQGIEAEEALDQVYPRSVGNLDEHDTTNLVGINPPDMKTLLTQLGNEGTIPANLANIEVTEVREVYKDNADLGPVTDQIGDHVDRFMVGYSGLSKHYVTFRKDDDGKWWIIDPQRSRQDSFPDLESALNRVKHDMSGEEGSSALFFIPQRVQQPPPNQMV